MIWLLTSAIACVKVNALLGLGLPRIRSVHRGFRVLYSPLIPASAAILIGFILLACSFPAFGQAQSSLNLSSTNNITGPFLTLQDVNGDTGAIPRQRTPA